MKSDSPFKIDPTKWNTIQYYVNIFSIVRRFKSNWIIRYDSALLFCSFCYRRWLQKQKAIQFVSAPIRNRIASGFWAPSLRKLKPQLFFFLFSLFLCFSNVKSNLVERHRNPIEMKITCWNILYWGFNTELLIEIQYRAPLFAGTRQKIVWCNYSWN